MLNSEDDVDWFAKALRDLLQPYYDKAGPVGMVANYEGFELGRGLEEYYSDKIGAIQDEFYKSCIRYTGNAFQRAKLKTKLSIEDWNTNDLFKAFSTEGKDTLSLEELREGFSSQFHMQLTPSQIHHFLEGESDFNRIDRDAFERGVEAVLLLRQ
jgi:hypothetical protein